jgi:hypothetical protein
MEKAINLYLDGYQARRVQQHDAFQMGFPRGRPWHEMTRLAEEADVLHVHHVYFWNKIRKRLPSKPAVVSVRGSPDRERQRQPEGRVFLHTCHCDLLPIYPQATFVPNFVLTQDVQEWVPKEQIPRVDRPVVFQPVPHALKHPQAFGLVKSRCAAFCDFCSQPGQHTHVPNTEQLANLSRCHISWDNLQGNFGNCSIEALALGALPIADLSDVTIEGARKFFKTSLPFFFSGGIEGICHRLEYYARHPAALQTDRDDGYAFWKAHWQDVSIIALWKEIYESLI